MTWGGQVCRQVAGGNALLWCVVQVGPRQWERVLEMVRRIRGLGMEVGLTAL